MHTATRLLILVVLPAATAAAQGMGAHVTWTDLGDPAFAQPIGYGFTVEQPISRSNVRWQLGFDAAFGRHTYQGSPCAGLVEPGQPGCEIQALHSKEDTQAMSLGLRVPLLWSRRASVSLAGDLAIARVASKTRDGTSTDVFSDWRMMYRPEVGVEARFRPTRTTAWSFNAGYAVGRLRAVRNQVVYDGYGPFDTPLNTKRAWLGVIWQIDPAAGQRRR